MFISTTTGPNIKQINNEQINTFAAKPKLYEVIPIATYILSVEFRERERERERERNVEFVQ